MRKKIHFLVGVICSMLALIVLNSAFTTKAELHISQVPFPQTGSITVYKYKLFQKYEIGELHWSAVTEKQSNDKWGDFCVVTLRVHNTTDEFIETTFYFKGDNGQIKVEVRPEDDFETEVVCSESVTGVVPSRKEITLQ